MHVYETTTCKWQKAFLKYSGQFIKVLSEVLFCQVLVMCLTVFGGLMAFNYNRALQVWAVPLLLVAFFAYFVAHSFLSVFETVLDALFLCFAVDLETNDGSSEKPYFMDQEFLVSRHLTFCCSLYPQNLKKCSRLTRKGGLYLASFVLPEGSVCFCHWPECLEWDLGSVFWGWTHFPYWKLSLERSEAEQLIRTRWPWAGVLDRAVQVPLVLLAGSGFLGGLEV